jgi:hypothetical protein
MLRPTRVSSRGSDWMGNPRVGIPNTPIDHVGKSVMASSPSQIGARNLMHINDPQTILTSLVPVAKVIGQILANAAELLRCVYIF